MGTNRGQCGDKLGVSNPKNKHVVYVSVLSQISNCQGLGRKNKFEILKTYRTLHGNAKGDADGPGGRRRAVRQDADRHGGIIVRIIMIMIIVIVSSSSSSSSSSSIITVIVIITVIIIIIIIVTTIIIIISSSIVSVRQDADRHGGRFRDVTGIFRGPLFRGPLVISLYRLV